MQQINEATLPEHYHREWWEAQLGRWSKLTLVAEHVPGHQGTSDHNSQADYSGSGDEIVGYALGQVQVS